jgi:hypothetical protein
MINVTHYPNEEVVTALMAYHKKRMNFDETMFTIEPELRLSEDGVWTVITSDIPPEAKIKVGWWHKLMSFVATGRME